jgi:SAM-dependent methyltransferase
VTWRDEAVALIGHRVHLCREREVGTLLGWAGDLTGHVLLDVAGGDGYWAAVASRRGARAVSIDIDVDKSRRGQRYSRHPGLVIGDALSLPVRDSSVDVVLSVCAIEHFDDGARALAEMARVLRPGGRLLMSADCLTGAEAHARERDRHVERYHVVDTYDHRRLAALLDPLGIDVVRHEYQFQSAWSRRLYLGVSAYGGRYGWNAAAPLAPLVGLSDRRRRADEGSIVLIAATKRPDAP